jgi:hypothetical protein
MEKITNDTLNRGNNLRSLQADRKVIQGKGILA